MRASRARLHRAPARQHGVAIVFADFDKFPAIADVTADFTYARLQRTREDAATGYAPKDIEAWAAAARAWEQGEVPAGLPRIDERAPKKGKRDVSST